MIDLPAVVPSAAWALGAFLLVVGIAGLAACGQPTPAGRDAAVTGRRRAWAERETG